MEVGNETKYRKRVKDRERLRDIKRVRDGNRLRDRYGREQGMERD